MKSRLLTMMLGAIAVAPVVAIACGGKVEDAANGASPAGTAGSTPVLSTAWSACPSDSAPLPMPAAPDPEQLRLCTQLCNRTFDCERCTLGSCLPNCLYDGVKSSCGVPYVAWMKCVLDKGDNACGIVHACDAEYCNYHQCAVGARGPGRPECH